jgi:UDP-N-acetyl-D-galactosamine dehydrogenase
VSAAGTALPGTDDHVAVVGLGYVGRPLALALAGSGASVVGYDRDPARVADLSGRCPAIDITADRTGMRGCDAFVIAVQTPVSADRRPDLSALLAACADVGAVLRPGGLVVIESTVHPGVTRRECVPVLESHGLRCGRDFHLAYAPERLSPGDPPDMVGGVRRIVGGFDDTSLTRAIRLYRRIGSVDLHPVASIEVAEMAKVVENAQRDVNVAFVNEIARACAGLDLDSREVLDACATKWNFHRYQPGLVGGHCIAVDPYYLEHVAQAAGIRLPIVSSARAVNDSMAAFVADRLLDLLRLDRPPRVGVLGFSYKAGVDDIRNTGVATLVQRLVERDATVLAHDPVVSELAVKEAYQVVLVGLGALEELDALVVAVAHPQFGPVLAGCGRRVSPEGIVVDLTGTVSRQELCGRRAWFL